RGGGWPRPVRGARPRGAAGGLVPERPPPGPSLVAVPAINPLYDRGFDLERLTLSCPKLKVRQVIRLIEDEGWYLVAQRGSHRQFKHASLAGRVTIAGHLSDDLPPRTLRSILRQARLGTMR